MFWFDGSIPDAINLAKDRCFVFVVVITGEDEQSAHLISSWEDGKVSEAAQNCCVAIKVDAKSETCVQFSQIYPVVCIPSSFFIGENGIPLEVVAGSVSAEELMKRIYKVKQMQAQQISGPCDRAVVEPAPASSVSLVSQQEYWHLGTVAAEPAAVPATTTASFSSREDVGSPLTTTPAESGHVCSDHASSYSQSEENVDTKTERLFKKLQEKQEQRKTGREENEVRREMERRKMGKNMQDIKKKQEEEKTKRLLEERNREKVEERAARERVKQQIALDRADRAARYTKTQEENADKNLLLQAEEEVMKEALLRKRSTIARIQFRLPDGSSFTNQFLSQSKLQDARDFVVQEVGTRYGNFSLATMFPRREFTIEDLRKTLLELELAPSATIVLLPQSTRPAYTVVQSSGGDIWSVLGTLLYPLMAVWRFLSSILFANPSSPGEASRGSSHQPEYHTNSATAFDKSKRENLSKNTLKKQPKDFKKDGKVCRLRTQEDSEDDTNTWNGNSTQQM